MPTPEEIAAAKEQETEDVTKTKEATTQSDAEKDKTETFTQADVNRFNNKTKREARVSARKELLAELGIEDVSTGKSTLADAKKLRDEQMSDTEKAQNILSEAKLELQNAQTEIANLKAQHAEKQRQSILEKALSNGGAESADDLYLVLNVKNKSEIDALFNDNGEPDTKAVSDFVTSVQTSHALYFKSAGAGSPSTKGGLPPTARQGALDEARQHIKKRVTR